MLKDIQNKSIFNSESLTNGSTFPISASKSFSNVLSLCLELVLIKHANQFNISFDELVSTISLNNIGIVIVYFPLQICRKCNCS